MQSRDSDLFDQFCNACYAYDQDPRTAIQDVLIRFAQNGVTTKQVDRAYRIAASKGITFPKISYDMIIEKVRTGYFSSASSDADKTKNSPALDLEQPKTPSNIARVRTLLYLSDTSNDYFVCLFPQPIPQQIS